MLIVKLLPLIYPKFTRLSLRFFMMDETPKLFLIDDCAGKNEYKDLINRLVLDDRSKNCQVILLAQDFKQIEPTIRRQASCISAFKTSGDSLDKLYKDMVKEIEPNKQIYGLCSTYLVRKV